MEISRGIPDKHEFRLYVRVFFVFFGGGGVFVRVCLCVGWDVWACLSVCVPMCDFVCACVYFVCKYVCVMCV